MYQFDVCMCVCARACMCVHVCVVIKYTKEYLRRQTITCFSFNFISMINVRRVAGLTVHLCGDLAGCCFQIVFSISTALTCVWLYGYSHQIELGRN